MADHRTYWRIIHILMIGWPCIIVYITLVDLQLDAQNSCLFTYNILIPEAAYIQLRRRPPEEEQGNARNMYRILINVLYVNKQELSASSWRSTKVSFIHSSSLTHSLHFRPAILHLLTTRSTVNTAACHRPFIAICWDNLITRPVAIITVPVTVIHMLWIIHRADSRAGEGPICCSIVRAVRINVLMLVKHCWVSRTSAGYSVNKPSRTCNCHQHT
jgi:hypothetical protein